MKTKTSLRVEVRERGKVKVENTPMVEAGKALRSAMTPTTPTVEVKSGSVEIIPIVEGQGSLCSALSDWSSTGRDIITFLLSNEDKERVMAIREESDKDRRRELKKQLLAITPAGVFHPRRSKECIVSYSGLLCIDIDGQDNPHISDWAKVTHQLGAQSPNVVYAGISAGGNGCFAIYRIATPQRYKQHWFEIAAAIRSNGLNPDKACHDISRVRYATYDPNPYLNREATPHRLNNLNGDIQTNRPKLAPQSFETSQMGQLSNGDSKREYTANNRQITDNKSRYLFQRVETAVQHLASRAINIAEDYYDWFRIGCALASTFGELGRPLFHTISAQSAKYRPAECDMQFARCMKCNNINIATLLHYFKQVGVRY